MPAGVWLRSHGQRRFIRPRFWLRAANRWNRRRSTGGFESGVEFGASFRVVESLSIDAGEACARVRLGDREKRDALRYRIHPALLDGCLQTALAAAPQTFSGAYLPFCIDRFETFGPAGADVWALARITSSLTNTDALTADINVVDDHGLLLARVGGIHFRRRSTAPSSLRNIYQVQWQRSELREHLASGSGAWLIVADDAADGRKLADFMRELGCQTVVSKPGTPLDASRNIQGIVRLIASSAHENPVVTQSRGCGSALSLVQGLLARFPTGTPRVSLVTQGAMAVIPTDCCDGFAQAPVWGLARTIGIEHPELRCTRFDVDPAAPDFAALAEEIVGGDGERKWHGEEANVTSPASNSIFPRIRDHNGSSFPLEARSTV